MLSAAIAAGRFPASRRSHYARMFDRDPTGTEALIAQLAAVPVPTSGAAGSEKRPEGTGLLAELRTDHPNPLAS